MYIYIWYKYYSKYSDYSYHIYIYVYIYIYIFQIMHGASPLCGQMTTFEDWCAGTVFGGFPWFKAIAQYRIVDAQIDYMNLGDPCDFVHILIPWIWESPVTRCTCWHYEFGTPIWLGAYWFYVFGRSLWLGAYGFHDLGRCLGLSACPFWHLTDLEVVPHPKNVILDE